MLMVLNMVVLVILPSTLELVLIYIHNYLHVGGKRKIVGVRHRESKAFPNGIKEFSSLRDSAEKHNVNLESRRGRVKRKLSLKRH